MTNFQEKLVALRERFRDRSIQQRERLNPPPRYDAVFFEGMEALDREDDEYVLPTTREEQQAVYIYPVDGERVVHFNENWEPVE